MRPSFFFLLGEEEAAVVEEEMASGSVVEWRATVRVWEVESWLWTRMSSMIRTDGPTRDDGTKPEEYWVDSAAKMAPAPAENLMVLCFGVGDENSK